MIILEQIQQLKSNIVEFAGFIVIISRFARGGSVNIEPEKKTL